MLKGYADEHVSHAIVRSLRARRMEVASVTERGAEGTPDEVLLDEALSEERIMLTCDTDFLRLAGVSVGAQNGPVMGA